MSAKIRAEERHSFDGFMAAVRMHAVPEPNSGCLLWLGQLCNWRPYFYDGVQRGKVARMLLEKRDGPANGRLALHSCDVPACVEPSHLHWGDQSENVQQSVLHGNHKNTRKKTCLSGHALDRVDSYGRRVCSVCRKKWNDKSNAKQRRKRHDTSAFWCAP
jgi:hypothetical protein